jgi:hypothetical protein
MGGRKELLLGSVPNRVSHGARCTVVIVNTIPQGRAGQPAAPEAEPTHGKLLARRKGRRAAARPRLAPVPG